MFLCFLPRDFAFHVHNNVYSPQIVFDPIAPRFRELFYRPPMIKFNKQPKRYNSTDKRAEKKAIDSCLAVWCFAGARWNIRRPSFLDSIALLACSTIYYSTGGTKKNRVSAIRKYRCGAFRVERDKNWLLNLFWACLEWKYLSTKIKSGKRFRVWHRFCGSFFTFSADKRRSTLV